MWKWDDVHVHCYTERYMYMYLLYLSARDLSLLIVSEMFALVGHVDLVGSLLVQILCLQAFFSRPAPPNFFISLHVVHLPQSFF